MESEKLKDIAWNVEGMTCSSCARTVTRFLEKQGMKDVFVDFASGAVKFQSTNTTDVDSLSAGIQRLGYRVKSMGPAASAWSDAIYSLEAKFYVSLVFTIPLLLHMVLPIAWLHNHLVQMLLCLPVFLTGLFHFGRSALGSLRAGVANMDVLIFTGSTAAFIYSLIGTFYYQNPDYLFFETSASIITLVLLGNLIEKRSVTRTRSAVAALTRLQPQHAKRIDFYGEAAFEVITTVDQTEIDVGEYYLVNSGDKIPADGVVTWGKGMSDESMISGESAPVAKQLGDRVIAGSILQEGNLKLLATAVGNNTTLSHIIEMVNDAQRNKPNIQRLADRVTAIFVPVVLMISIITFLASYFIFDLSFQRSLMSSIGVLVVSCPCAMGLATPTAVMVGIGRAAKKGILIKGAQTLETLPSIKTMVFDKTGTLTTGQFRINRVHCETVDENELMTILVSLEKYSSHPIAVSLVTLLKQHAAFTLSDITEHKGVSIAGKDAHGNRYEAGSFKIAASFTKDQSYNVYVLKNDQLAGMADIGDEIRSEAKAALQELRNEGIYTVMLSGDREETCARVAQQLGIDRWHAQKSPSEKLQIIHELQNTAPVAMVGDGINDAPALSAATIGISLSHATSTAVDSAQIILLHNNLGLLPEAYKISRHTLLTIRQNLFWAFCYNLVAIPIAAIGWLRPIVGAASMAFSDVMVIGNSLRLRTKKLS